MINKKISSLIAIDPGTHYAGIAFFKDEKLVKSEQLKFKSTSPFYSRLNQLKHSVRAFLSQCGNICYVAIETPFIGFNPQAGLKIGQARGVIICLALDLGCEIIDIAPQETRAYYGVGTRAKKEDYQRVIKLEFKDKKLGEDEADAIAIGFTAIHKVKQAELLKRAG